MIEATFDNKDDPEGIEFADAYGCIDCLEKSDHADAELYISYMRRWMIMHNDVYKVIIPLLKQIPKCRSHPYFDDLITMTGNDREAADDIALASHFVEHPEKWEQWYNENYPDGKCSVCEFSRVRAKLAADSSKKF